MKIRTISIVMAATILLVGCSKQSGSSGTASSPASEQSSAQSAATAANITGTWKWVAPANPDGQIPAITFTLNAQGEALTGTVNMTAGAETITNGVVKGDEVTFQTIRQKKAGQTTITYSGKISGDKIKGTVKIDVADRTTPVGARIFNPQDWEADRVRE